MTISNQESSHILVPTYKYPFPLDLKRAALLVIDMQNAFCNLEGFCGNELGADLSAVRVMIPSLQRMVAWAREHGLLIIVISNKNETLSCTISANNLIKRCGR
ncbi:MULTISPECIES: isochorismatase family protein, partial [unclassified Microcoleus]|uniref:isochorismatase family protein n=1 Tax=unclassified Microcoleus TaxID=2642155 RepID=UPI002FD10334